MIKKQTVFKYVLKEHINNVRMHKDSMVLCVQIQRNYITMWVLVDASKATENREFYVFDTGVTFTQQENELFSYIGTVQFDGGDYIQHVFEKLIFEEEEIEEIPF